MAFLGQEEQIREFQDRFKYLYAILFLGLGLLLSRLVYLQILKGDQMRRYSEENRIKRVKVAAPRGMIFDRNRKLLIDNRPAFDLEITPQYLSAEVQAITAKSIALLAKLVHMTEGEIDDKLDKARGPAGVHAGQDQDRPHARRSRRHRVLEDRHARRRSARGDQTHQHLRRHRLPPAGLHRRSEPDRAADRSTRTASRITSSATTSASSASSRRWKTLFAASTARRSRKSTPSAASSSRKAKAAILASSVEPDKPAVPGKNLILTIDQDLQLAATKAFGDKIGSRRRDRSAQRRDPGHALAPVLRSDGVLARHSARRSGSKLLTNQNHPLRDKTIQDHYPPGSTFKIVTAIAGLEEGVIDENTNFHCPG